MASNIAEGYGRASKGEYKHFLGMARGSTLEIQTQIVIAREMRFADTASLKEAEDLSHEVGKMLWVMLTKFPAP